MAYTLITGASGGIGKELAHLAAKDKQNLILVARNKKALQDLAAELPAKTEVFEQDLSLPGAAKTLIAKLDKKNLKVKNLINDAGFGNYGEFAKNETEKETALLMLNVVALTELTKILLPQIIKNKGAIMNVGSLGSFMPGPKMSTYFASKAYVLHFSEGLHEELKSKNVSVTCLCPGPTNTGFAKAAHAKKDHYTSRAATTPKQVVRAGWKGMKQGKAIVVPGFKNKITVILLRFLPRSLVRKFVYRAN